MLVMDGKKSACAEKLRVLGAAALKSEFAEATNPIDNEFSEAGHLNEYHCFTRAGTKLDRRRKSSSRPWDAPESKFLTLPRWSGEEKKTQCLSIKFTFVGQGCPRLALALEVNGMHALVTLFLQRW